MGIVDENCKSGIGSGFYQERNEYEMNEPSLEIRNGIFGVLGFYFLQFSIFSLCVFLTFSFYLTWTFRWVGVEIYDDDDVWTYILTRLCE